MTNKKCKKCKLECKQNDRVVIDYCPMYQKEVVDESYPKITKKKDK